MSIPGTDRPDLVVPDADPAPPDDVLAAYGVDRAMVERPVAAALELAIGRIQRAARGEEVEGVAVEVRTEGQVTVTARYAGTGGTFELVSQLDLATGTVLRSLHYLDADGNRLERTVERTRAPHAP
jgi:hypothetical protein